MIITDHPSPSYDHVSLHVHVYLCHHFCEVKKRFENAMSEDFDITQVSCTWSSFVRVVI